jgi:hypothetical protein
MPPPTKFAPLGRVQSKVGAPPAGPVRHLPPPTKFGKAAVQPRPALPPGAPDRRHGPVVAQRKLDFQKGTEYLADQSITVPGYRATLKEAGDMPQTITVRAEAPGIGTAVYTPNPVELSGEICIKPLHQSDLIAKNKEYHSRLIAMAHETRHGIDDLTKQVRYRKNDEEKIHTEWRAFATQSAVAIALDRGVVEDRYLRDIASFASREAFMSKSNSMVGTTASYLQLYGLATYDHDIAIKFMKNHTVWIDEAIQLFQSLMPPRLPAQVVENARPSNSSSAGWGRTLRTVGWIGGTIVLAVLLKALHSHYKGS